MYTEWFKLVNKYLVNIGGYKVTGDLHYFFALGIGAHEVARLIKAHQGW